MFSLSFFPPVRFCAAGEEREARGQNHCAPATRLAFWKGISSFSIYASIPSHSSRRSIYLAYERASDARTPLG
jgi:hypothetical protein